MLVPNRRCSSACFVCPRHERLSRYGLRSESCEGFVAVSKSTAGHACAQAVHVLVQRAGFSAETAGRTATMWLSRFLRIECTLISPVVDHSLHVMRTANLDDFVSNYHYFPCLVCSFIAGVMSKCVTFLTVLRRHLEGLEIRGSSSRIT